MTFEEQLNNISDNISGIYMITNIINNKKYIGQAINLKKRIRKHIQLSKSQLYDAPIYRAINKYGIDNFSIEILFETSDKDYSVVKRILDEKEKYYIREYNTYGEYNQTLGGDAGILGYKFNKNQIDKVKIKNSLSAKDGKYMIYIFDIINKSYYTFVNSVVAANYLNLNNVSLRGATRYKKAYLNKYLVAYSKEKLTDKINNYKISGNTKYYYIVKDGDKEIILKNSKELAEYANTTNHYVQILTQYILKGKRKPIIKGVNFQIGVY